MDWPRGHRGSAILEFSLVAGPIYYLGGRRLAVMEYDVKSGPSHAASGIQDGAKPQHKVSVGEFDGPSSGTFTVVSLEPDSHSMLSQASLMP
jgi:hypothetical protein